MPNEFLDDLFGDHEGIVYSPIIKGRTKETKGKWEQHFFEWPQERQELEAHLNDINRRDVYLSPVLFTEKAVRPDTFKGTNFLWTEFDGSVPKEAIPPSIKIVSSQAGHEHWYWRLKEFTTDKVLVEDYTRRIAYHYGADLSVWDYQNVLRPPDTWNYKHNKPVTLVDKNDKVYTIEAFNKLPIPAAGTTVTIELDNLPPKDVIFAKYKWSAAALDLLFKDGIKEGKRSDALARLAHEAIEVGASNEETYVLLEDRDRVWGKFVGRSDREKRLQEFITNARGKRLLTAEITHGTPEVFRYNDFMRTKDKLKWAIEGLLPVAGSMVIFGRPGIGKSTFSLRTATDLALGKDKFLIWNIVNKQRTMFISLEMQHYEVKEFFEDMKFTDEEAKQLQENFFIWPIGSAYPLDTRDQQMELLKKIDEYKIELIVIDSLGLSMYGSVTNDDDVKRLNSFLNEDVRRDRKCSYIFIHHPRKDGIDRNRTEIGLDDMFGSQYIAANAQTVIILSQRRGSNRLHVKMEKRRMSIGADSFDIERTPNRGFQLVGLNSEPANVTVIDGETLSQQNGNAGSLGSLFNV